MTCVLFRGLEHTREVGTHIVEKKELPYPLVAKPEKHKYSKGKYIYIEVAT